MTGSTLRQSHITTPAGVALSLSEIGFGAAPIGNMGEPIADADAVAAVTAALDGGVTYVDVAPLYGHGLSERRVGAAIERRHEVVLSTKVGRLLEPCAPGEQNSGIYKDVPPVRVRFAYDHDSIKRSLAESRERIGRPVDIVYVHDVDVPTHGSQDAADARIRELIDGGGWRALTELRAAGEIKAIGVGVNDRFACLRMLDEADPDLFLVAGRYTLLDQSSLDDLLPRCAARGVSIVIGGPYNSGILATGPVEGAWYDYAPASEEVRSRTARIAQVCAAHGVPLPVAALAFPLRHPSVVSVIPGGRDADQVRRNLDCYRTRVPDALWEDLKHEQLIRDDAPC
ncbi:aldo/keto reductase [Stakelama saccharophila]|uniref:Aldo/keto reductase n=1 Tax=Stakelama saccharophila TaxID=3075605 RepID=A0ABZ0B7U3_9SPHN|nr:aldo/keto reductase [Stakelama sp. W311]WNO52419.1 aldo/keto reductase [Stakelama sp. W311]